MINRYQANCSFAHQVTDWAIDLLYGRLTLNQGHQAILDLKNQLGISEEEYVWGLKTLKSAEALREIFRA